MKARSIRTRLFALPALALGVAAMAGTLTATHAHAASPPSCSYLYWDDSLDGPDNSSGVTVGPNQPNLNIIEGDFGLTPDHASLRAVLTLENQAFQFSSTGPGIDYQMVFQYGTNAAGQPVLYATDASLTVDPNGGPPTEIFNFGLFQGVSTTVTGLLFTQFVVTHPNVPGSFGLGPNGTVEVDVPLADITTTGGTPPPSIGATLTGTQGYTASGQGNQGAGNEFISDADPNAVTGDPTGTFGHNYTLGQTTCIDSGTVVTPEAPLTVGLLLAGGVAVSGLAVVARRRRAARIRPAA